MAFRLFFAKICQLRRNSLPLQMKQERKTIALWRKKEFAYLPLDW